VERAPRLSAVRFTDAFRPGLPEALSRPVMAGRWRGLGLVGMTSKATVARWEPGEKHEDPQPELGVFIAINSAATYSPRGSTPKYHRRYQS
jgi:hypothetical protein